MDNKFLVELTELGHLHMCLLNNKEQYYKELQCLDFAIIIKASAFIANNFIIEAKYLIVNAIKLFEFGYFDCAYYCLREAIEISTIMVYLVDIPEKEQEEKLRDWINLERFPMRNQMIEYLKNNGTVFIDFKEKMKKFFENSKSYIEDINKYVHKQGWNKLYVIKKFYDYKNNLNDSYYLNTFEKYLKFTISYVAIMRLSIDPLPILSVYEDVYVDTGDITPEPYTKEFIDKYINNEYIEDYKKTKLYKEYFDYYKCKKD